MESDVNYTQPERMHRRNTDAQTHTSKTPTMETPKHSGQGGGQFRPHDLGNYRHKASRLAGDEAPTTSGAGTRHRQRRWEGAQARMGAAPELRGLCAGQRGSCIRLACTPGPKPGDRLAPTPRLPDRVWLGRSPPPQARLPADEPGTPTTAPPPWRVSPWR